MRSDEAKKLLDSIDTAIQNINGLGVTNPLERAYIAGYLLVFISGIYEESIETIINERIAKLDDPYASQYVEKCLKYGFRNPHIDNIINLLKKFSRDLISSIRLLPHESRTAINNIVNDKNSLAHGTQITTTLNDVIQYYHDSRIVIETIDNLFL